MDLQTIINNYKNNTSTPPAPVSASGNTNLMNIVNKYKAENPGMVSSSVGGGTDYYSQIKSGAYNPLKSTTSVQPTEPSLGSDLSKRVQIVKDVAQGANKFNPLTPATVGYATLTEGLGALNDIVGKIASKGNEALGGIPSKLTNFALQHIIPGGTNIAKLIEDPNAVKAIQDVHSKMSDWATQHPDAAAGLDMAFNALTAVPWGEGAVAAKNSAVNLEKNVIKTVGKIGEASADIFAPISKSVKTELIKGATEGNAVKQEAIVGNTQKYMNAAKMAAADNSKPTPLELAGQKGEEALGKLKEQLNEAGKNKQNALNTPFGKTEELKVGQTTVGNIGETRNLFNHLLSDRLGMQIKNGELANAPGRLSLIEGNPADVNLIKQVDNILTQVEPGKVSMGKSTLQEVNDAVDSIQGKLYASKGIGAAPINSKTESVVKQVIQDLNEKAKETADIPNTKYRQANEDYANVRTVYDALNKGLGIEGNKGSALMKQLFSPNGTMARNLFSQIKDLTGIDLVNEATLAKHAMETVGDSRQKNLLSDVIGGGKPTTFNTLLKAAKFIGQKAVNPEKRTMNIANKALKKVR